MCRSGNDQGIILYMTRKGEEPGRGGYSAKATWRGEKMRKTQKCGDKKHKDEKKKVCIHSFCGFCYCLEIMGKVRWGSWDGPVIRGSRHNCRAAAICTPGKQLFPPSPALLSQGGRVVLKYSPHGASSICCSSSTQS